MQAMHGGARTAPITPPTGKQELSVLELEGGWECEKQNDVAVEKTCRSKCRLTVKSEVIRGVGGRCH